MSSPESSPVDPSNSIHPALCPAFESSRPSDGSTYKGSLKRKGKEVAYNFQYPSVESIPSSADRHVFDMTHQPPNAAIPPLDGPVSRNDSHLEPKASTDTILHPVQLPGNFFPDASRSLLSPGHSPERPTGSAGLDGAAISREALPPPSNSDVEAEMDGQRPQEPPEYTARPMDPPTHHHRITSRWRHKFSSNDIRHAISTLSQKTFLDILFLMALLAITGVILKWAPIWHRNNRLFPMTFDPVSGVWLGPTEYSYPRHDFYLGISVTTFLIPMIPIVVILLLQYWIRSWTDLHAALFAFKKAMVMMWVDYAHNPGARLIITLFIQVILKAYIGEFRPWFIAACNPDPFRLTGLRAIEDPTRWPLNSPRVYANPTYCRGKPELVTFALTSFPSGHTSQSFMAGTFLALYLNAKLKPFSDYHTEFWKMVAILAPLIGSMFIAGSLVADRNHHHHDIILSIPLGVLVALLAYRTHYASIFDYRSNHLPLPWSSSHQSLNPTVSIEPDTDSKRTRIDRILTPRNNNFTATAWPRKPKTYTYARRSDQTRRTTPVMQDVDGVAEHLPPVVLAGGHTLRRRYGMARRGRSRVTPYPERDRANAGSDALGSSGGSTAIDLDGQVDRRISRRITVDEWADARTHTHDGDMV